MIIRYDSTFLKKLKKIDVKVRKSFKTAILIFAKNPYDPQLNNHSLKRDWQGYRSIDVTADYRAVYEEKIESYETIAHFVAIGTHKELYK